MLEREKGNSHSHKVFDVGYVIKSGEELKLNNGDVVKIAVETGVEIKGVPGQIVLGCLVNESSLTRTIFMLAKTEQAYQLNGLVRDELLVKRAEEDRNKWWVFPNRRQLRELFGV